MSNHAVRFQGNLNVAIAFFPRKTCIHYKLAFLVQQTFSSCTSNSKCTRLHHKASCSWLKNALTTTLGGSLHLFTCSWTASDSSSCFSLFTPLVTVLLRRVSLSDSGTTLTCSIASEFAKNEISSKILISDDEQQLRQYYSDYPLALNCNGCIKIYNLCFNEDTRHIL